MLNKIIISGMLFAISCLFNLSADTKRNSNFMQKFAEMCQSQNNLSVTPKKSWSTYSIKVDETGQTVKIKFPHKPEKDFEDDMTTFSAISDDVLYALNHLPVEPEDLEGKTLFDFAQDELNSMVLDDDIVLIDSEIYEDKGNVIINTLMKDTYLKVVIHGRIVATEKTVFILVTGHEQKNKKHKHDYFIDSFQIINK